MELSIQKSSRFLLHFFIATNIANKPLSDCITSLKTILPFHFSPKPTAEGETKRQQSTHFTNSHLTIHMVVPGLSEYPYRLLLLQKQSRVYVNVTLPPQNVHYPNTCHVGKHDSK